MIAFSISVKKLTTLAFIVFECLKIIEPSSTATALYGKAVQPAAPGPSPGFSSRGGQKLEGGPHFKNTVLDVCSNQGAKREMGGTDFKWGGRAPLPLPAGDDPARAPRLF